MLSFTGARHHPCQWPSAGQCMRVSFTPHISMPLTGPVYSRWSSTHGAHIKDLEMSWYHLPADVLQYLLSWKPRFHHQPRVSTRSASFPMGISKAGTPMGTGHLHTADYSCDGGQAYRAFAWLVWPRICSTEDPTTCHHMGICEVTTIQFYS